MQSGATHPLSSTISCRTSGHSALSSLSMAEQMAL
jgi:hypothetical protein